MDGVPRREPVFPQEDGLGALDVFRLDRKDLGRQAPFCGRGPSERSSRGEQAARAGKQVLCRGEVIAGRIIVEPDDLDHVTRAIELAAERELWREGWLSNVFEFLFSRRRRY